MANNVNRWVGSGTLTRDPEPIGKGDSPDGCRFSIASNEAYKKRDSDEWTEVANFFDIVCWGKVSMPILKHLTKGSKVTIDGRLKQERWDDATTGQKRSKVTIHAQQVEFGPKPSASTSSRSDDGFDSGSAPEDDDSDLPPF